MVAIQGNNSTDDGVIEASFLGPETRLHRWEIQ